MSGSSSDASARDDLARRVSGVLAVPLHRFLGIRLADETRPEAGLRFTVGDAAVNNAGVLHGGILTAMLDVACYLAVLPLLEPGENAVTHNLSASVMRAVPAGADVQVAGTVLRRGRSLAFLHAEARVGDQVAATASVTKSVLRPRSAAQA